MELIISFAQLKGIGLLLVSIMSQAPVGRVSGGVCWEVKASNNRCYHMMREQVSREECCSLGSPTVAWTPSNPTPSQIFEWKILGYGASQCQSCHTTCKNVSCPIDKKCKMRNGSPKCVCSPNCSHHEHKRGHVCSIDGTTFRNYCSLLRYNCRHSHMTMVDYYGNCKKSCSEVTCEDGKHCVSDQNGVPHCITCPVCSTGKRDVTVCGSDGKTYYSLCEQRRRSCLSGNQVRVAYPGPCKEGHVNCSNIRCPSGSICLRDFVTNMPHCVDCTELCSTETHGRQPVCGTDNQTYPNWCSLMRSSCRRGVLLHTKHSGPCQGGQL